MGTYTFKAPPTLQQKPDDPVGNQSFTDRFADMQAQSSNSGEFQAPPALSKQAANPEGKESFAQRFAEMQAASSNSGEWKASPSVVAPAYATAGSGAAVASQGQKLAPSRTAGVKRDEGATSSTGR
jgi:hypothetical protein